MLKCKANCLHRANVNAYQSIRSRQEAELEQVTNNFSGDVTRHLENHPMITFKKWLTSGSSKMEERDSPGEGEEDGTEGSKEDGCPTASEFWRWQDQVGCIN